MSIRSDNCIKFFCDNMTDECNYVKMALMELNVPTIDTTVKGDSIEFLLCSKYYVVVSNNLAKLRELFTKTSREDAWEFRTHSRILIFYSGKANFNQKEFVLATNKYGFDILVVQNFNLYHPDVFGKRQETPLQSNQVISLSKKTVLAELNGSTMIFHEKLFQYRAWKPTFNNWTFQVAVAHCPPFVMKTKRNNFRGIDIEIVEETTKNWLKRYVDYRNNIPYQMMQDDLFDDKVDLAVCSQWRESLWSRGLDVSFPYSQHCGTFLVPKPYVDEKVSYTFIPIQFECWIIIVVASFIVALLVTIYAKVYLNLDRRSSYLDYLHSTEHAFKMLCLNMPSFPPATFLAFRIIWTFWCLTAMIITTSYSAGYTTVLTYPKLTMVVDTFEDMVKQNIHWGGLGDRVKETVAFSLNSAINGMYKNYFNDCTNADINHRIRYEKDFAVFVKALPEKYITDIDHLDDFAKMNLRVLPRCTRVNYAGFAFARNSPFPSIFDKYITIFLECGLMKASFTRDQHMNFKSMARFYTIYGQANNTAVPLDLKKLEDAFNLIGVGFGISIAMFLFEILYYKLHKAKKLV
ncbi:hypothetical protein Trydic_g21445 [Trypoxylus dichotomus]